VIKTHKAARARGQEVKIEGGCQPQLPEDISYKPKQEGRRVVTRVAYNLLLYGARTRRKKERVPLKGGGTASNSGGRVFSRLAGKSRWRGYLSIQGKLGRSDERRNRGR